MTRQHSSLLIGSFTTSGFRAVAISAVLVFSGCQQNEAPVSQPVSSVSAFKGLKQEDVYERQIRQRADDPDAFEKGDPRLVHAIKKIRTMLRLSDIEISMKT